ncbi:MAG TPA: Asp-tRNA(Asn)/Glu-tRNA(Gln) amidotransferase subunit GatA [Kiritimatiellia bacterium]|nr:Asp-tRNA(Asn)/Glu-tRNA(Gln) amidotransferase subunit GatA [Kiritimatiellia bacterium]HMO99306.1 Asp-tRNA(Asn)/Glu-tRNA(Gln) amidotransferase subunit GatA [Kiritimatiellia bacterium]HMP95638.1 Asp-tRNA(Asn)/Glu-tRNA(Gln) amidotransferase subunit GatA [Kiritimatiellia bacterium]
MAELHQLTLVETLDALARGDCSAEDVARRYLERIAATDSAIGAFLELDPEQVLADARAADAKRRRGEGGRLLGAPIAMKDVLNVKGASCTCGSKILRGYRAPYDATAVARLRAEGAVIMGRLNMDEFAMGSSNENSAYHPVRNPYDLSKVPGGSSGGSAASVAADQIAASLGTDTGGSIRQPASFCGCVGVKPSYGRVSRYGLTAFASSLDQIGPLTKDVADAALLTEILSGFDPADSTSVPAPAPELRANRDQGLAGMTLGLPREYFQGGMDPEVEQRVREAVEVCRSLGAEIMEISLPHTEYAIATYYIIATAEASANLARFDGVRYGARQPGADPIAMYEATRSAGFGNEVKRRIILGTYVLSSGYYDAYYLRAQKVRALIRRDFDQAFQHCQAILTPATPSAAFGFGEKTGDPLQMYLSDIYTVTTNLAGICGMSLPCGFTAGNLPVGLQILGPAFREEHIFRVAYAYEQATRWRAKRPPLAVAEAGRAAS